MILIAKQVKNSSKYYCNYSKIINKNIEKKDLNSFLYKKEDKRFSIFESSVNPKELIDENITFLESRIFKILDKIEANIKVSSACDGNLLISLTTRSKAFL